MITQERWLEVKILPQSTYLLHFHDVSFCSCVNIGYEQLKNKRNFFPHQNLSLGVAQKEQETDIYTFWIWLVVSV